MDWFNVALVILFVVLPLLEQVLARRRRGAEGDAEIDVDASGPGTAVDVEEERPRKQRRVVAAPPGEDGGWSDGWTPWPTEPDKPPVDFEETLVLEPAPEPTPSLVLKPARPYGQEAEAVPTPVLRPVEARPPRRTPPARPLAVGGTVPIVRGGRSTGPRPVLAHLGHDDLRTAVVLNEILGKPVALREPPG